MTDVYEPPYEPRYEPDKDPDPATASANSFERSWREIDLDPILNQGWTPPPPTIGSRSDGVAMLYAGKTHSAFGESESGKTWFAIGATRDRLNLDDNVVYLDFEDDAASVTGRLLLLGVPAVTIGKRFHYVRPDAPIGKGIHRDDLRALINDTRPSLVVLDGVTEAMAMHSWKPNDGDDIALFRNHLLNPIARTGAAVLEIDHVTKSAESRGRYPIGGAHKINGLTGAAFLVKNRTAFGIGRTGKSGIYISKDRGSHLRNHSLPAGEGLYWFGDLELTGYTEGFAELAIDPPQAKSDTPFRPTHLMANVMAAISQFGPEKGLSKTQLRQAVTGRNEHIDAAIAQLGLEGYLTDRTPFKILKPWEENPS